MSKEIVQERPLEVPAPLIQATDHSAPAGRSLPMTRIEPASGWVSLNLAEVWRFRELLYFLTWRDVIVRYKQTALGASWAIIQPFLTMVVFSLFFGHLANMPSDGIPYPVFSFAALVPWTFFANGLTQSSNSLVGSANLIQKVYFPRLMIPAASVLGGIIDFILAFVVLLGMMAYYHITPSINVLWLPAFLLLALITALGVGLWLSALNVRFRDVRYVVPFITQFWLFATPIAYPSSLLEEPWRTIYGINPMVGVVEGVRWALLGTNTAPGSAILVSSLTAVAVLVSGAYYFAEWSEHLRTSSDGFVALGGEPGTARPILVVGEVAQAHDGSLGFAHAYIDAIAAGGAHAVKFQTHMAAAESTAEETFRIPFSKQDSDRRGYWKRMEFTEPQWIGLKQHADERGLLFLSSPFSEEAFEMLLRLGVPAWKVASGEVSNRPLLDRMIATGLPILLSSGISPLSEIDDAAAQVKRGGCALTVLQCTTAYPCGPESIGLNLIPAFRERYGCPVGLSDHSGTIYPSLAAATIGAALLEVHVTMSREMFGPDVSASVTTTELRQLTAGVAFIEKMMANPVDKNQVAAELAPLRTLFTKSVVLRTALDAGTVLRAEHLTVKKPGTGIPAAELPTVVGARLSRNMEADAVLRRGDLESTL